MLLMCWLQQKSTETLLTGEALVIIIIIIIYIIIIYIIIPCTHTHIMHDKSFPSWCPMISRMEINMKAWER